MPTPTTTSEFFDLLNRSGLFTSESAAGYANLFSEASPAPTPQAMLRRMIADGSITPFQAKFLLAGRFKGFFLGGKYKLLANIGSGGMGDVYLAEHMILHRLVAIKILKAAGGAPGSTGAVERFFRAARAAAALRHPNIAQLYDVERNDASPYMVMEFLDGANLHTVVGEHGPLSVARAVNCTVQVARGLRHAHENGLIHRDIKPGNLILERDGTVKILDLGLARFHQDNSKNNNLTARFDDNGLIGTADFIAPEQTHDSSAVDGRADIYSLGCTLYFMLAGQAPYQDGSIAQKLLWHQLKPAPPIAEFRNDVPPELLAVLNTMMAKDPSARQATAAELQTALAPWFEPGIAPPPPAEMPRRLASSYRLGLVSEAPEAALSGGRNVRAWSTPPAGETAESWLPTPADATNPTALPDDTVPTTGEATRAHPKPPASDPSGLPAPPRPRRRWLVFAGIQLLLLGATVSIVLYLDRMSGPRTTPAGRKPSEALPNLPDEETKIVFRGGGSSFIADLMEEWRQEFPQQSRVGFAYEPTSSGAGKALLFQGHYDFACTDAFLTVEDMKAPGAEGRTWLHVPLAMGGVAAVYNLPGLERRLRFSGPLLSAIFRGKITRWNDPLIVAENRDVPLPDRDIRVVFREEKSGTTAIWTEFLAETDPEGWGRAIRKVELHPAELVGMRIRGNDGVAELIKKSPDAIGYVELNVAIKNDLTVASVRTAHGTYLQPTLTSITKAAEEKVVPPDLKYSIVNSPGIDAYPISGFTWAIVDVDMTDKAKRQSIAEFLLWAINDGQRKNSRLNYAPLPKNVRLIAEALLMRFKPIFPR